jgi:hypothetical protein
MRHQASAKAEIACGQRTGLLPCDGFSSRKPNVKKEGMDNRDCNEPLR